MHGSVRRAPRQRLCGGAALDAGGDQLLLDAGGERVGAHDVLAEAVVVKVDLSGGGWVDKVGRVSMHGG